MKKTISLILIFALVLTMAVGFTGCGNGSGSGVDSYDIVCVDYMSYSLVTGIIGDIDVKLNIKLLNDSGVDVHSYEPSVEDMAIIKNAKVVIFEGGSSENWIIGTQQENFSQGGEVKFISLTDRFMASRAFRNYEDKDDEHLWASVPFVEEVSQILFSVIEEMVIDGNATNNTVKEFEQNAASFINELGELKEAYANMNPSRPIVIADRNPIYYLLEDSGIEYEAAYDGCSAETEASFEVISKLAGFADENQLDNVLYIEAFTGGVPELCKTVIGASERLASEGDSCARALISLDANFPEGVNMDTTYLGVMWSNYYILSEVAGATSDDNNQ